MFITNICLFFVVCLTGCIMCLTQSKKKIYIGVWTNSAGFEAIVEYIVQMYTDELKRYVRGQT